ncbi:133_t:CDS:2 [Diversispora eburnea]|uniref:133_t:CDS:1 n=1 Tax=Diversispora eburnea TaxID=1213867 RepID=A0A9N8VMI2_9GLOM|nr:133_t:CDS:2 [Diversispora eburnea]
MSNKNYKTRLISIGNIVKTFHYGHFASNWWTLIKNKNIWIPWRVNCRICVNLNEKEFVLRIIAHDNNSIEPGFISETEPNPQIHSNISAAINTTYKKLFKTETRYSGLDIFNLEEMKLENNYFSNDETLYFAGSGYISSFNHKVRGDQYLIVQTINEHNISIHVYRRGIQREEHFDISPKEVWKKMTICQEKNPMALFGLTNLSVQSAIKQQMETPLCNFKQWMNLDIMTPIFQKYLKRQIGMSNFPWHNFFSKWLNQKSKIIELTMALADIYPIDYKLGDREFRAWKQVIKIVGCTNITPFSKNISQVSNNLITAAKNFARINGPGCFPITKPIVTHSCVSKIQDQQFEAFFSDKNNVSMSSYIVDKKMGLPLLYLKDNKQTLWEKFEATYPDSIKRTSVMGRLASGRYVYKQDLGGLCSICNDYGYEVFDLLIELIETNIIQKEQKQTLIHKIETLCYHMRREYEKELLINLDGTTDHVEYNSINNNDTPDPNN